MPMNALGDHFHKALKINDRPQRTGCAGQNPETRNWHIVPLLDEYAVINCPYAKGTIAKLVGAFHQGAQRQTPINLFKLKSLKLQRVARARGYFCFDE
ncbi:hypothetical protein GCM10007385_19660 [Tateyamaria omphalii]|nr:hypothetical protein GCM10007385_19660 [Tateyamaria omphalii]